ncbi:MAG: hypothetical protein JNL74_05595, partial [Fibrobacteres bacterium]|nr:hypothetical protein [Fibrobacterota bacterium]
MVLSKVVFVFTLIALSNIDVFPALPSESGPTVALIKASKERTFIALGAPAADSVWGKAYGRAWGGKGFIGVPHLRAAFLAGEGYHSGIRTVNGRIYGLDDYWYYDINGHRWVNIFPGTDVTNFKQNVIDGKIKVDSLGRGLDSTGMPLPCHLLIHAWGYLTYDSDAKKIIFYGTSGGFSRYFMPGMGSGQPTSAFQSMDGGLSLLEAQGLNKSGPVWGPWAYNTVTGKFEHELANNGRTLGGDAFGQFMYIPSKKKLLYAERQAVWYDPAAKLWSSVVPTQSGLEGIEFS